MRFYSAVSVLVGTIIGAGILGIPYVVAKSGFLIGIIEIIGIGILMCLVNLMFGEVILRTKGEHQFVGYAGRYFGKRGRFFSTFIIIASIYGALIAYIIGVGKSMGALTGINPLTCSLVFFVIVAILLYFGLNVFSGSEFFVASCLLIVTLLLFIFGINYVDINNFSKITYDFATPYGVIFFACLGFSAIPLAKEVLGEKKKILWKVLLIGMSIPIIVYLLFTFLVVGISGSRTTEIATLGLNFHPVLFLLGNLFAILAMFNSFVGLGFALKEMYIYDFGIGRAGSWCLACLVPLIIFLLGVQDFIQVISVSGALAGGLTGVMIVMIFFKAKKKGDRKPEYQLKFSKFLGWIVMLLLILGIVLELVRLLG